MPTLRALTCLIVLGPCLALAQPPSDSLFATDQVIDIQLTFAQTGFDDSLVAYYNEGLERQLEASVVITDLTGPHSYASVGVRYKGNSSYGLANKKSMKIDFNEYVSGQKYHGMKKINLNNGFNDPTLLREKVFFDFCQDQGVLAPRAVFGNVRMNGTLTGFYGVVEQVDKEYLDRWVDDTSGNLFKAGDNFGTGGAAAADLAWYGTAQGSYEPRYELKTNEAVNDWTDLIALIDAINNTSDAQLQASLPSLVELQPLLRSLAIDNLFANLDSYINSARNWYLYHNDTTGLWQWIKWDANEAFGRYSGGQQNLTSLSPYYLANNRPLMSRIMNVPWLRQQYTVAYCAVYDAFDNAQLDPRIDALAALIQPHVFADPNKQYTNTQFTTNITSNITGGGGPGGNQTIYGLKSFINARRQYLTGALDCATIGIAEQEESVFRAWPNPMQESLRVSLPSHASSRDLTLCDALGRPVGLNWMGQEADVSGIASGPYVLTLRSEAGLQTLTLLKQ